jgi:hypothetical protein
MSAALGSVLQGAGVALIAHAAYAAVQYKGLLDARYGVVDATLPVDVYVELVVAAACVVAGALLRVRLAPIYASAANPME